MTKEERELSITYLEEIKESYIEGVGYEKHPLPEYYAIENAIKALEQAPTTKNDKVDCKHTDCNNCVNHKYCDYEPTAKNDLSSGLEKNSKKLEKDFGELDCISRKAVLDAIDSKAWEFCDYLISKGRNDEQKPVSHFADNLRECVREEIPSVTPQEPKIGHWITKPHIYGVAFCSECGFELRIDDTNYCPNCGADMREVEE